MWFTEQTIILSLNYEYFILFQLHHCQCKVMLQNSYTTKGLQSQLWHTHLLQHSQVEWSKLPSTWLATKKLPPLVAVSLRLLCSRLPRFYYGPRLGYLYANETLCKESPHSGFVLTYVDVCETEQQQVQISKTIPVSTTCKPSFSLQNECNRYIWQVLWTNHDM